MNTQLKHLLAIAALCGVSAGALAAEQIITCPQSIQVGVTSNLPDDWQATPQVGGLQNTTLKTVGKNKMMVCNYRYGSNTTSVMRQLPAGANCRSIQGGFSCTGAGGSTKSVAAAGAAAKSSSSSKSVDLTTTQTRQDVPVKQQSAKTATLDTTQTRQDAPVKQQSGKTATLDTTQTRTNAGPGTVKGSSSGGGNCPDLAFTRAFVEQVSPGSNSAYNVMIVAQLLNQGSVDYRSSPDQQQVSIIEEPAGGKPRQVAIEDIGGYRAGQLLANESGAIRYQLNNWRESDEFPPSYRFKLVFDPDIRQDGNPDNDDCNGRNDQIVISGADIVQAIKGSTR